VQIGDIPVHHFSDESFQTGTDDPAYSNEEIGLHTETKYTETLNDHSSCTCKLAIVKNEIQELIATSSH